MSQLMFWNKQNNNNSNSSSSSSSDTKVGKRNWLHTPEALINGHVVYLVKFFGSLAVDQAKGIEVVKDAIRKLQFAQQMKKADTGSLDKCKKVEITISVDGVAVQEPRTQKILYQFPLHNISYCADEKGVKKFFSFIAKTVKSSDSNSNNNNNNSINNGNGGVLHSNGVQETHECFLFISNKLASDITLTIGQAFDLAYRKYINNVEKPDATKTQQQISELENIISIYKHRLRELAVKVPKVELESMLFTMNIKDILELPANNTKDVEKSVNEENLLIDTKSSKSISSSISQFAPVVPPRNNIPDQVIHKSNVQKMGELLLNSDSDSDFDPRAEELLDSSSRKMENDDLFGFEPSKTYGQQLFNNNNDSKLPNNNTHMNNNNVTSDLNMAPLLAPPPKAAIPRRGGNLISNNANSQKLNGSTDLFGSDPFDPNESTIFKNKGTGNPLSEDFSLESLDPLRK